MHKLNGLFAHLSVILAMVFAVFLVLDLFNPLMNFVNNPWSRGLLTLFCLCAAGQSITAWKQHQRRNKK